MNDEPKVWIRKRTTKRGAVYSLRWIDPVTHRTRSRHVGTTKSKARDEVARLREQLGGGTYTDIKKTGWATFAQAHIDNLEGERDRERAVSILRDFENECRPKTPRHVTYAMLSAYVCRLRDRGNTQATRNTKLRYVRRLLLWGVRHDYIAKSPFDTGLIRKEDRRQKRIISRAEEATLLASAENLYGFKMIAFLRFLLATWARTGEATKLEWHDVNFEDGSVLFRNTKSHEDRYVPIARETGVLEDLRRLQAQTLQDGGPFRAYADRSNLHKKMGRIVADAGVAAMTLHDLRRTSISRALLRGMPLLAVKEIAGHKDIKTTMEYYAEVSNKDLREWVNKINVG